MDVYSKAGGLAEEALSSVRNVVAFGAHDKLRKKYAVYLDSARDCGVKKAPLLGIQYSTEFSIAFCAYSLAFWYGVKLMLSGGPYNGGTIITYVTDPLRAPTPTHKSIGFCSPV